MKAIKLSVFGLSAGLLLVLQLALSTVGCKSSPRTPSTRLAAIIVTNKPVSEIEAATQSVFKDQGYITSRHLLGDFVFEKQGTGMNTLVYGDWSEKAVWVRVKLSIRRLAAQQHLVECDAYMVNDHGDARFEEEHKLTRMHRGRYQELLEQIGQRLR